MKRTVEDQQYGLDFARAIEPHYQQAITSGESEKRFASRLGVDRGGLQRYLKKHATPSIRTLVFAYREFGIIVPYAATDIGVLVARRGKRVRRTDLQMTLPLIVETPASEIDVVLKRKTPRRYRLEVSLKKEA